MPTLAAFRHSLRTYRDQAVAAVVTMLTPTPATRLALRTYCDQALATIVSVLTPTPMTGIALLVSFPFCLYGYDVAVLRASTAIVADLSLTKNKLDFYIICMSKGGYALGALAAGATANWLCGRRFFLGIGGGAYVIGALVVAFTSNYAASMFGRGLGSFGVGMGLLVGPIFIAETAPSTTRGYHGTIPLVMMMTGTMWAYVMESILLWAPSHIAWRVTVGIAALPTAAFAYYVVFRLVEDTPCWEMMCGRVRVADDLMERCGATGTEPYERREQLQRVAGFPYGSIVDLTRPDLFPGRIPGAWVQVTERTCPYFWDMFVTMFLLAAQEAACEQMTLLRFVPFLLYRNGLTSRLSSGVACFMLTFLKMLTALTSMRAASRSMAGRKTMLLVSTELVACSLVLLSVTTFSDARERIDGVFAFALSCITIVVLEGGIAFGLGPIPWMYGPEVFPLAVRAPSLGVCLTFKFAVSILVDMTFSFLYSPVYARVWLPFLVACGASVVSFFVFWWLVSKMTCRVLMDEPD